MKIDGIKKKQTQRNVENSQNSLRTIATIEQHKQSPEQQHRNIRKIPKRIINLAMAVFMILLLSIATNSGTLGKNSQTPEQKITDQLPRASELKVEPPQLNLALKEIVLDRPEQITLPREKVVVPDPFKKRKEFLKTYLSMRGSVLANHIDTLSEQSQWRLVIGISRAESQWCRRHMVYNCWGIGGAANMRKYRNYDEAIADVNRIIEQYYIQSGLNSPKKMVKKWVGHPSENWEAAVEEELENLKNID